MKEIIQSFHRDDSYHPFYLEMCGISFCDGSYYISRTNSTLFCFEYVIKGTGTIKTNNKVFHPSAGDIYILHEGHDHYYYSDKKDPWVKIWFNIKGDFPRSTIMQYGLSNVNYVSNFNLYPLFSHFINLSKNKSINANHIFDETSLVFLQIVQKISEHLRKSSNPLPPEALTMKEYIHENIEKKITINELADLIHLSYSQTIRIFKNVFSTTPYDYILDSKIEMAKIMLQNTNMKILEISNRLNFSNEYYFSNIFKQKTNFSPKAYRNSNH